METKLITFIVMDVCHMKIKMIYLYLFMYADDTVLFSEDVIELQNMIHVVNVFSNKSDLNINVYDIICFYCR
jgi:hypothetical protein